MKITRIQPTFIYKYILLKSILYLALPFGVFICFLVSNFPEILNPIAYLVLYFLREILNFSGDIPDFYYGLLTLLIMSIYFMVIVYISSIILRKFYKKSNFTFNETNITYTINFLIFSQKHVNYSDIKEINLNQGPLQRLFGLATIKITTQATTPNAGIEIYNIQNYSEVYNLLMAQTGHQR